MIDCTLSSMISLSPNPFIIIVSSLVIYIFLHLPKTETSDFSKVSPISSETTVPPVIAAMSFIIAFLLSPKAGALTAHLKYKFKGYLLILENSF